MRRVGVGVCGRVSQVRSAVKQQHIPPAVSLQLRTGRRSSVTYEIIRHVWKGEGQLTVLVVTIGEGCGDQRSLQHRRKHADIQGFCSLIIESKPDPEVEVASPLNCGWSQCWGRGWQHLDNCSQPTPGWRFRKDPPSVRGCSCLKTQLNERGWSLKA